jgi:hypothetical protein
LPDLLKSKQNQRLDFENFNEKTVQGSLWRLSPAPPRQRSRMAALTAPNNTARSGTRLPRR